MAVELAVSCWRASFCGNQPHQNPHLRIAIARAGNVTGGGDWDADRIVPDAMGTLAKGKPIGVRMIIPANINMPTCSCRRSAPPAAAR